MDRGRVGYDLVSNKFLREQAISHKRDVHLDRLKKIKHRAPGSSSTLDNTVPESLKSKRIANNPRKRSKQTEKNIGIERQNKVLLQRISNILTAPPKITDKEYQDMKKLMASVNQNEKFSKSIAEKRNKVFFDRVNKTGPYYRVKEWEKDYKRQKDGQKFMRQVTYERPKDWVDPFAEVPKEEPPKRGANRSSLATTSGRKSGASGSHVNRVKSLRGSEVKTGGASGSGSDGKDGSLQDFNSTDSIRGSMDGSDRNQEALENGGGSLSSRLLASVERMIAVTTLQPEEEGDGDGDGGGNMSRPATTDFGFHNTKESFNATSASLPSLHSHTMEGFGTTGSGDDMVDKEVSVSIFCSLVDDRVLFITIDSNDEDTLLHAEAQIDCNELMIVDMGEDEEEGEAPQFPTDPETQETLAFDLINEITLCREFGSDEYEIVLPDTNRGEYDRVAPPMSEVTVEEAKMILEVFDPVNHSCGINVPVEFVQPQKSAAKPLMKQKTSLSWNEMKPYGPEKLHVLIRITRTGEEKAIIRAHTVRNSVNKSSPRTFAIPADTAMELVISLPSILAIESELVLDYFRNAALNIRIQHNCATRENTLLLGE